MQELVNKVYVDDQIKNYVIKLVLATRRGEKLLPELQRMVRCGARARVQPSISPSPPAPTRCCKARRSSRRTT